MKGDDVDFLSGVHGYPNGIMIPEPGFFADDVEAFGRLPGVTVHNVAEMSAEEIAAVLSRPGTIVGGFCNSAVCLARFQ